MKRVGGWLQGKPGQVSTSKPVSAADEEKVLEDALASAALIMNDEMERAESELSQGNSAFHKLGRATAIFLKAALGFEREIMEVAGVRIAEAEEAAAESQRQAIRHPSTAHQSSIYPPGSEYALCHAETLLMSAVVAVLNESVTESLRGFYKLRKAFGILSEMNAAEERYLKSHGFDKEHVSDSDISNGNAKMHGQEWNGQSEANVFTNPLDDDQAYDIDEDDDLEFVDAKDVLSALITPLGYDGHLEFPGFHTLSIHDSAAEKQADAHRPTVKTAKELEPELDFRTVTTNPIDLYIHSGVALCYGLLQLLLSMIPPSFARVLSIFSFRGDRENGFRLLWSATSFKHNINGAMAGLIYLGFHNGPIATCDILSRDMLPLDRLRPLLAEMRAIYPKSKLWLLEECRMLSRDQKLEAAVNVLKEAPPSPLRQVEALATFEMSLHLMHLHRYQECSESFIKCVSMNNWSHALYYYIAGACQLELYRINNTTDPETAKQAAKKAEKYFLEVPMHTQKKRFMGRQLPFDAFTSRKIAKWQARAKSRSCSFVDAIGVSPLVEMIYFWHGISRMDPEHVDRCLARLAWSEDQANWKDEPLDEQCVLHLLRAVCHRCLDHIDTAKTTLRTKVIAQDSHRIKACDHPESWPLPVAHFEMAVCYWKEAGGENGDKAILRKCSDEVVKVESWEAFELDARIGLKVTTARETLKKCGVEMA